MFFPRRPYLSPPSYPFESRSEHQIVADRSSRPRHQHDISRAIHHGDPRYVPPEARLPPLASAKPAADSSESMAMLDRGSSDVSPTPFYRDIGGGDHVPSATLPLQIGSRQRRATLQQMLPPPFPSSLPLSSLEADPIARGQKVPVTTGFAPPARYAPPTDRVSPDEATLNLPPLRNVPGERGDQYSPLPRISPAGDLSSSPLGSFRAAPLLPYGGRTDAVPAPPLRSHRPDPPPTKTARDQQDGPYAVDDRPLTQRQSAASRHRRRHPMGQDADQEQAPRGGDAEA